MANGRWNGVRRCSGVVLQDGAIRTAAVKHRCSQTNTTWDDVNSMSTPYKVYKSISTKTLMNRVYLYVQPIKTSGYFLKYFG